MTFDGTLKVYYQDKGFGFITPERGSPLVDVFFHVLDNLEIVNIEEGEKVTFDREYDCRKKKFKGVRIQGLAMYIREWEFGQKLYSALSPYYPEDAGWMTARILAYMSINYIQFFFSDKRLLWTYIDQLVEIEGRRC